MNGDNGTLDRKRELLQSKINDKIAKSNEEVKPMIDQIERDGNLLVDFIAPLGNNSVINFNANGTLRMSVQANGIERGNYSMHTHAVSQAGEKFGIPQGYIRKLADGEDWERKLAAYMLNEHGDNGKRARVLVRVVGDQVRGILSDHYRRLNTTQIYGSFFDAVKKVGAVLVDAHVDDTRTYVETINPEVIEIPTGKNGTVYTVYGMRISNSDFGDGALMVQGYMLNVECINGWVRENLMRQIHLGGKLPDNIQLSKETYKFDTLTQSSLVSDLVKSVFDRDNIERQKATILAASDMELDLTKEVKMLSKKGILKGEIEEIEKVLISNRAEDGVQGEGTLWKLSQAVTAVARNQKDGRRKREIEDISGKLFDRIKLSNLPSKDTDTVFEDEDDVVEVNA